MPGRRWFGLPLLVTICCAVPARAGVVNPDISVIGQPFMRWTDDAADPARKRVDLNVGETEFVFDADLNPYARGTFVAALDEDGMSLEEGYFTMTRGLPLGLALRGGKYRAGFGKMNPMHPHALPFAERFRVLAAYLPGEESFNETAVQVSELFALPGDVALTVSADWEQGGSFRIERAPSGAPNDPLLADPDADRSAQPLPGGLGRISAFVPWGDRSGIELGVSGTQGTNNVAAGARTTVLGGDVKAKLWTAERAYLLVQGELLRLDREDAGWDEIAAAYTTIDVSSTGGYVYADYNFETRYNVGVGYERFQQAAVDPVTDQAFRAYAGLALMEETTAFRLDWERYEPGRPTGAVEDPDTVDTFTLRVVFSMGPHKAHQF